MLLFSGKRCKEQQLVFYYIGHFLAFLRLWNHHLCSRSLNDHGSIIYYSFTFSDILGYLEPLPLTKSYSLVLSLYATECSMLRSLWNMLGKKTIKLTLEQCSECIPLFPYKKINSFWFYFLIATYQLPYLYWPTLVKMAYLVLWSPWFSPQYYKG